MYHPPLVPDEFDVPEVLETERMQLRMLCMTDAEKDYAAVMESEERLKTVFEPGGVWPTGLTLEQNTLELAWHQVEFQNRNSFAYTVVALDESEIMGCLYFCPTGKAGHDVDIRMWVRQSRVAEGLDEHLFVTVRDWVTECWPFTSPVYPGRVTSWAEYEALPEA